MGVMAQPRTVPVVPRLSSTRTIIQRQVTFTSFGLDVTKTAEVYVSKAFRENREVVSSILPEDWRSGNRFLYSEIESGVNSLRKDITNHGVFNLNEPGDVKRLAELLASRTTTSNTQTQPVLVSSPTQQQTSPTIENPQPQISLGTEKSQPQPNKFIVETPLSKERVVRALNSLDRYYKRKDESLSKERKKLPQYENFNNSRSMIDNVYKAIAEKTDEDISNTVRIARNPNDRKSRVAAIIVHGWEPPKGKPMYVEDLLAHPKALKPPKPNKTKPGSEALIKGGGRALLENAVLENPAGIILWPLNDTARGQYLKMKFGEEGFKPDPEEKEEPENNRHLVLTPENIRVFAKKAQGLSKEVIDKRLEKKY